MAIDGGQLAAPGAAAKKMSLWQIAQAASLTRISPARGGASIDFLDASGAPNSRQTAALMGASSCLPGRTMAGERRRGNGAP